MKSPRLKHEYDKSSKPSYLYSLENKKELSHKKQAKLMVKIYQRRAIQCKNLSRSLQDSFTHLIFVNT